MVKGQTWGYVRAHGRLVEVLVCQGNSVNAVVPGAKRARREVVALLGALEGVSRQEAAILGVGPHLHPLFHHPIQSPCCNLLHRGIASYNSHRNLGAH